METTIVYWGFIGIMEKKMEATIIFYALRLDGWRGSGVRVQSLGYDYASSGGSSLASLCHQTL